MKILHTEHAGIGGLYFIIVAVICSLILTITVRISWDSQAEAMADNLAYITSINTAANSYLDNVGNYSGTYNGNLPLSSRTYAPLADFNSMLTSAGISSTGSGSCRVTWNASTKSATVQYGQFRTSLGSYLVPHRQESVIEND